MKIKQTTTTIAGNRCYGIIWHSYVLFPFQFIIFQKFNRFLFWLHIYINKDNKLVGYMFVKIDFSPVHYMQVLLVDCTI